MYDTDTAGTKIKVVQLSDADVLCLSMLLIQYDGKEEIPQPVEQLSRNQSTDF